MLEELETYIKTLDPKLRKRLGWGIVAFLSTIMFSFFVTIGGFWPTIVAVGVLSVFLALVILACVLLDP